MAKKIWANNDHITPAYLNGWWGTDALSGHIHDGGAGDFNLPKVDLNNGNEVGGSLPMVNLNDYATGVTGVKVTTSHLTIEQTANLTWERVGAFVSVHFPEITGFSNSVTLEVELQTGTWDSDMLPTDPEAIRIPCVLFDNSVEVPGFFYWVPSVSAIMKFGVINAGVYDRNNFVNSGAVSKGISRNTLTWMI